MSNNTVMMKEVKVSKWYFGGFAAAGAACFTHPLDLIKVQLQTQKGKKVSIAQLAGRILKQQGIFGLYNGISASVLRQLTYSTVRFGIYETTKQSITPKDGSPVPFAKSISLAGIGGFAGGFVGNPADLVNVRMQNDIKLPKEQRRNYKNAIHGVYKVATTEGVLTLWRGASMTCPRSALMTIGQVACYDEIKSMLIATKLVGDTVFTHVTSSIMAGAIATTLCQPVDVIKTRAQNAKPGEVSNILGLITITAKEGPLAFFKGYIPAFVRLAPHSILTFVFLEQLRMNFGNIRLEEIRIN